jgi:diadenosine tetraphosphate (Ap4A) HIT family hydrolase
MTQSPATPAQPPSIAARLAALRAGQDAAFIARLGSGWVVLGDPQVLAGYCLLIADPEVPHLNALAAAAREAFLADMARLGDAVSTVTRALRVNYAIFGNVDPLLHAHVFPRRLSEPERQRAMQPFALDWGQAPRFDPGRDAALVAGLRAALKAGNL